MAAAAIWLLVADARADSLPRAPESSSHAQSTQDADTSDAAPSRSPLETPTARRINAKVLLITGGILAGTGLAMFISGLIVVKTTPFSTPNTALVMSTWTIPLGAAHLVVGPILLGVGGYRYNTPLD